MFRGVGACKTPVVIWVEKGIGTASDIICGMRQTWHCRRKSLLRQKAKADV